MNFKIRIVALLGKIVDKSRTLDLMAKNQIIDLSGG